MTRHAIRLSDNVRPCRKVKCQKPSRWRAAYIYSHSEGTVLVPYCLEHLTRFATAHQIAMPKEALA